MKSAAMKKEPVTSPAQANDIAWRKFPLFEQILSAEEASSLLANIEKTCQQLHEVIQTGSEAGRARAQAGMVAYGRSLDLLRLLTEMRDKAAQQK